MDILKINLQRLENLYLQISKRDHDIAEYEDFLRQPGIPEPTRKVYKDQIDRLEKERIELIQKTITLIYDSTKYPYKDLYLTLRSYVNSTYEYNLDDLVSNYDDDLIKNLNIKLDELEVLSESIKEIINKNIIKDSKDSQYINSELSKANTALTDNDISIQNKLKLTIPIIPFLLSYQAELSVNNKVKLNALWSRFKRK